MNATRALNKITRAISSAKIDRWEADFFCGKASRGWKLDAKKQLHRALRRADRVAVIEAALLHADEAAPLPIWEQAQLDAETRERDAAAFAAKMDARAERCESFITSLRVYA